MLRVYLDQNKWIDLARAASGHGKGTPFIDALDAGRAAVESGWASFPLDFYRYAETGKHSNAEARIRLADFMFELSRQETIAHPRTLLPGEIDVALNHRYGRPAFPRKPKVFGTGITHILEVLELPKLDWSRLPSGHGFTGDKLALLKEIGDRVIELELLRAGPETARSMGIDTKLRDLDDQFVADEERVGEEIRKRGLRDFHLELAVRASDLGAMRTPITEALDRVGMSWESFADGLLPTEAVSFVDDLPTRQVANVMRAAKLRQSEQKWERNDFNDIAALSVAVVHCDVVVTEKQWVHRLHQAGVDRRYGTTLLSNATKLPEVLARASAE